MSRLKFVLVLGLVVLLTAVASAGAAWWVFNKRNAPPAQKTATVEIDPQEYNYVSLEKVIVMLRGRDGEPMSHYLAVDLVFKTPVKKEKMTKEHLPLLRALTVKALSSYTLDRASQMTVEQFADDINKAFTRSYAQNHGEKPFTEAMIGKLIIE